MPELPEVEIVKRSLKKKIYHKKIKKIIISNRNLRFKIQKNFEKILKYAHVTSIYRFSKYIILAFKNKKYCIIHLGMSGTLHLVDYKKEKKFTNLSFYKNISLPKKHNHIKIKFDNFMIVYNDPRRFGFFTYIRNEKELKSKFRNLGPEPLSKKFNIKYLLKYFFNKKKILRVF